VSKPLRSEDISAVSALLAAHIAFHPRQRLGSTLPREHLDTFSAIVLATDCGGLAVEETVQPGYSHARTPMTIPGKRPWSSAAYHAGTSAQDRLVESDDLIRELIGDQKSYLQDDDPEDF